MVHPNYLENSWVTMFHIGVDHFVPTIRHRWLQYTVKPCFTDTLLLQTPHYYRQFALSLGKESPYVFSRFDPLNMDTPLIQTLLMDPSVSQLMGFDCSNVLVNTHKILMNLPNFILLLLLQQTGKDK